jgi:hypothetical protein
MKTISINIFLFLVFSFCLKAKLNNQADPTKASGIAYAFPISMLALTGSRTVEVIPVALNVEIKNFPEFIDNSYTISNIELKFNKDIDSDTTVKIKSLNSSLKIDGLEEKILTFTKVNARYSQTFTLLAASESQANEEVKIEIESSLIPKMTKTLEIKNSSNSQALIVKNASNTLIQQYSNSIATLPGDTFTYSAVLKLKPSENIIVSLDKSNYTDSPTIDKTSLIFNSQNYNVPQTFTITMPPVSASLQTSFNKSYSVYLSTLSYIGFTLNFSQSNINPSILVIGNTTINKGSAANFDVSLSHKPDANRTVTVTLNNSRFLSLNKTSFNFTPENYNVAQSLQITASPQNYIFGSVTATFSSTDGFSNNPVLIKINDPSSSYLDVTAGDSSGLYSSIAIDSVNSKLIIARTLGSDYYFSTLRLSICNLDGTSCISRDVSAMSGQGNGSGNYPSIVIDTINSKILISTENYANNRKPSLFRCNLDGTACTHIDISAGRGNVSGRIPKLLFDSVNSKILLITSNSEPGFAERLSLFRCNLDGSSCTFSDISAGRGDVSAYANNRISAGIDTTNSKLLAVAYNNFLTDNRKAFLYRCDLNGTNCTATDISAGQGNDSGRNPSLVIDSINGKFFVSTTRNSGAFNLLPSIFKCNLDGTSCTHFDLGTIFNSKITGTTVFLDNANSKVLVATTFTNNNSNYYPGLFRCNLNLTGCTFNNLALTDEVIFENTNAAASNSAIIDTISAMPRILVLATTNIARKTSLIRILRDFVD